MIPTIQKTLSFEYAVLFARLADARETEGFGVLTENGVPRPRADESRHSLPPSSWLWIAVEWWFLGLVAYHLILEHRAHVFGALPYVIALATLLVIYLVFRHRHRSVERR